MTLVRSVLQTIHWLKTRQALAVWCAIVPGLALCLAIAALAPMPSRADLPAGDGPSPLATELRGAGGPERIELDDLEMPVGPIHVAAPADETEEPWAIGFVFYDGAPVAGASATLESRHGSLSLTTQPGPLSSHPYFTATLSAPPLQATLGELVELQVSYGGESNFSTFMVVEGMQQVYGWLSSICGPTVIPGTVIGTDTVLTQECGPYILTGNLLIHSSATLTVTPGTSFLLDTGRAIRADGALWAEGATNAMISFMPYDEMENWGYILLSGGPSRIWAARMERGGGADVSDNAMVRVDAAPASLAYVTVRDSEGDGVRVYNDAAASLNFLDISDSAGWGLYVDTDFGSLGVVGNEVRRNGEGGIYVGGGPQGQVASNVAEDNGGSGIWIHGTNTYALVSYNACQGNEANKGGGIRWNGADGALLHNVVRGNSVSGGYAYGGGIFVNTSHTLNAQHNIVLDNVAEDRGGGVYFTSSEIRFEQNVIDGNTAPQGGGAYVAGARPDSYLRVNAFLRNQATGEGGAVYIDDLDASTHNNTILWNTAGADQGALHLADAPYIGFNNLYGNGPYDVVNADVDDANAEFCWWNTIDTGEIDNRIWDLLDDPTVGWVNYSPIFEQNNPLAPMAPPTGLVASTDGLSVTLHWNATEDTPFDGYLVYYEPVANGYPYTGTGAAEGDSPIFVGDVTSYTLTSLPAGTYHLAVTARDQDADGEDDQTEGHESWFSDPATAEIVGSPQADFDASPVAGAAPLAVDFTDTSSGYYQTRLWGFGDGITSTLESPTHIYATVGVFDVSLTVSGSLGTDTLVRPAFIRTYEAVNAAFTATPTEGAVPLQVDFTNASTGNYDTCAWTFGDSGTSDDCNDPQYTYDAAGDYTVVLTVSGLGGIDTETKVDYITGYEPVVADFSATPTEGSVPLLVDFTNTSTGDYSTCTWAFGDGGISNDCNDPQHTYHAADVYTVELTVSGPGGDDTLVRPDYVVALAPGESYPVFLPLIVRGLE
jgi:PKD repeat protein